MKRRWAKSNPANSSSPKTNSNPPPVARPSRSRWEASQVGHGISARLTERFRARVSTGKVEIVIPSPKNPWPVRLEKEKRPGGRGNELCTPALPSAEADHCLLEPGCKIHHPGHPPSHSTSLWVCFDSFSVGLTCPQAVVLGPASLFRTGRLPLQIWRARAGRPRHGGGRAC